SAPLLKSNARREIEAPRVQPVVLGLAQLALRHGIAAIRQVASREADLVATLPVAEESRQGRVVIGEGRVALVEVTASHVAHLERAEDAVLGRPGQGPGR